MTQFQLNMYTYDRNCGNSVACIRWGRGGMSRTCLRERGAHATHASTEAVGGVVCDPAAIVVHGLRARPPRFTITRSCRAMTCTERVRPLLVG